MSNGIHTAESEVQMSEAILVGYATRSGSTREIAEAVAVKLREGGTAVDCQPLKEVKTLEGYRSVVIGAPFYMFHWHKDAVAFLKRHHEALTQRVVAVFALGPFNDVEKEWQGVREQLDKELAKSPWLDPIARVRVVGDDLRPVNRGQGRSGAQIDPRPDRPPVQVCFAV